MEEELDFIKTEPSFDLSDDESLDIFELKVPFLKDFIGYPQEFFIGDEEVELNSVDIIIKEELSLDAVSIGDVEDELPNPTTNKESDHRSEQPPVENTPRSRKKRTFECYLCGYTATPSKVISHFVVHTGIKSFECSVCGMRLLWKTDIKRHLNLHKGVKLVKSFKCSYCPIAFIWRSQVVAHERSHTGEKPYACDECPMKFSCRGSLIRHKKSHSGDKAFQCETCLRRFISKYSLRVHRSIHNDGKPFECPLCPMKYKRQRSLNKHMKLHEKENTSECVTYDCDECGTKCSTISSLNRHKQLHTRENRYRCDICFVDFVFQRQYFEHMNSHNDLV